MKTLEQIATYKSRSFDDRDIERLVVFLPEELLSQMGIRLKPEHVGKYTPTPLTREAVVERLKSDVAFGIEKYMDQRGLSTMAMTHVVRMWLWVLDDETVDVTLYGGKLFEATALAYGFPVPDDMHTGF